MSFDTAQNVSSTLTTQNVQLYTEEVESSVVNPIAQNWKNLMEEMRHRVTMDESTLHHNHVFCVNYISSFSRTYESTPSFMEKKRYVVSKNGNDSSVEAIALFEITKVRFTPMRLLGDVLKSNEMNQDSKVLVVKYLVTHPKNLKFTFNSTTEKVRGAGTAVMQELDSIAKKEECKCIFLLAMPSGYKFYKKLKFEEIPDELELNESPEMYRLIAP